MTTAPETPIGSQLNALLPEIYRSRDNGDLAALLDGFGHLLGRVRDTLEQRLADSFPDEPLEGLACQTWLLPYFAELVGARLVSPDPSGQRAEVADAIAWRQIKGTPASVEQVAQAVGRFEVEIQEGWSRVAVTPRTGWPLPTRPAGRPAAAPFAVDRPAGTVAFGFHARALRTAADDPEGHTTRFIGETVRWRQAHPHGSPCFPGSYEDPSARTVDLRSPDWRKGHFHPRRLLLYYPPPAGFFAHDAVSVAWADWGTGVQELENRIADLLAAGVDLLPISGGRVVERLRSGGGQAPLFRIRKAEEVLAERTTEPDGTVVTRLKLEEQWLEEKSLEDLREFRALGAAVHIEGNVTLPGDGTYVFEKIVFLGTVTVPAGRLVLRCAAAKKVTALLADNAEPVLDASSALFESLDVRGLARLEFVTVLGALDAGRLQASDSILLDTPDLPAETPGTATCIRYSRVDAGALTVATPFCTAAVPLFIELDFDDGQEVVRRPAQYGEPGCGVLHPACPRSVRSGAEDGGEMGAYHDRRFALAVEAVSSKLEDFLPLGLQAVLIPDPRLLAAPPAFQPTPQPQP